MLSILKNKIVIMQFKQINVLFWQRFLSLLLIVYFSQTLIAELCFKHAKSEMNNFNIESAIKYFELARRFTPYNSEYYYQEANYWNLAVQHGRDFKQAAARADQLFDDGLKVNPYEVKNLLSRAVLHRDFPELLVQSATETELLEWFDYILYWRPQMIITQYEYIYTLLIYERTDEAEKKLKEYLSIYPKSELLLRLNETIKAKN